MKFEVGDKVKYIGEMSCFIACNSIGTIIRPHWDGYYVLFPKVICSHYSPDNNWFCVEKNLVKFPLKNMQLVFSFMDN